MNGTHRDRAAALMSELVEDWKRYDRAEKASKKEAEKRAAMPIGQSRARVTTANARWARKTEARDKAQEVFEGSLAKATVELCRHFSTKGGAA